MLLYTRDSLSLSLSLSLSFSELYHSRNVGFNELVAVCKKSEVVIIHGKNDKIIPVENSRRLKEGIEERGGKVTLKEVEGGHCWHEETERYWEYF